MAASAEDERSKKYIQEQIWVWSGRILALLAMMAGGFFWAWLLWGSGVEGAPELRKRVVQQEAQILELKNHRVDIEGQLTVCKGRQEQCERALAQARAGGTGTATP